MTTTDGQCPHQQRRHPITIAQRIKREFSRPFRRLFLERAPSKLALANLPPILAASGPGLAAFDPQRCTVEPDGLELLKRLVRESAAYPGPIVEIGTLLGVTATHMALAKQPGKKIVTVDNYCWNPWNLPADAHHALTKQVLHYLIETGHVRLVRIDKAEFYRTYQGPPPSLVFLDAWHTYEETKKDIEWAISAGAAVIAGHDYSDEFSGVRQVVDEFGGPAELAGTVWALPRIARAAA